MNIDKSKLIKPALILVGLFVLVFVLTKIAEKNSITLTEYMQQHPESVNQNKSSEQKEDGNNVEITETVENPQNEPENAFVSELTGATLNADTMLEQRITYADYFYYEPLSDALKRYITGISFPSAISQPEQTISTDESVDKNIVIDASEDTVMREELAITYDELRYVHILHYDFNGKLTEGELICNEYIAQDLVEIFYELYRSEYQLEKVLLIDEYDGDDNASMEDNNTSCFNYRMVADSNSLSKHAQGLAIDINPLYNPYITYAENGGEQIAPANATPYADRNTNFPYKIDENDLCYKLFTKHGFTWGGNWNSSKDYQHFQKMINPS